MSGSKYSFRVGWAVVVVVGCVLVQSAHAQSEREPFVLVEAIESPFTPADDCIVHDFTPVGQALHASGSTGGLFEHDGAIVLRDESRYASLLTANDDVDVLTALGGAGNVATIIVLDDFRGAGGPGSFRIDDDRLENPGDADEFVRNTSHGSMVLAHVNALIRDTDAYDRTATSDEATTWTRSDGGSTLHVVPMQLEGEPKGGYVMFDHEARAQLATGSLIEVALGASVVVVNMSWVILPCLNVADYDRYRSDAETPSFSSYESALSVAAAEGGVERVPQNAFAPRGSSPLDDGLPAADGAASVIYVASSGNQDLPFDLYPAAFPSVITVGARDAGDYSNAGQVYATGGWFPLSYLCCDGGTTNGTLSPREPGLAYAGTSFAAPSMSVFAAIRANECADRPEIRARADASTQPRTFAEDVCR